MHFECPYYSQWQRKNVAAAAAAVAIHLGTRAISSSKRAQLQRAESKIDWSGFLGRSARHLDIVVQSCLHEMRMIQRAAQGCHMDDN
jgi:hypothetical protein